MSNYTSFSDIERKRPNVSSKSLLNLKNIVTQNITSNSSIEKSPEVKYLSIQQNDDFDEIENKKRKKSTPKFPNPTALIEYLIKPDLKQLSTRSLISSKEEEEPSIRPLNRIVIPRRTASDGENIDGQTVIANEEELVTQVQHNFPPWTDHIVQSIESNIFSNRQVIDNTPTRRPYPQFESVRTPAQEFPTLIPSDLLDCCDSNQREQSNNSDSFHTSVKLRAAMINISKRLAKTQSLVMVDTHCHFDLIFDRLSIKHNNLKQYFDDYQDFYPSGLSFELAIQVFWRPRHLTEKNWTNWYSKYLNDKRVYGSCGIHPHWSFLWTETSIEDIERCLRHPKIVAIGEIGLDLGPKNTCNIDQQGRVFEEQLKLAVKWRKPVVIHSRDAYQQTFQIMKQHLQSNHKIHLHCFVGSLNDVHLFTSYFTEIKFGFTPVITRGNCLHTVIQQLDLTQILSETDSPYFVPEELSNLSRSAHPGMVYSVIETIAQLRQISVHDVACQLRENAYRIYGV